MKKMLLIAGMLVFLPCVASGGPIRTAEYRVVPTREYSERQDQCHLMYYNYCSGWVGYWSGYCFGYFPGHLPVLYGTCFDLADCPGECRHLEEVWFACRAWYCYGRFDVEIYCADQNGCPLGAAMAGVYNYCPPDGSRWHHFDFDCLSLCECEDEGGGKFVVMITDHTAGLYTVPNSDVNSLNIEAGCEDEWRCQGHSFVYRSAVSYCDVYGAPAPLWVQVANCGCTNPPTFPPGCHSSAYDTGHYCEWLIDCYVSCLGPTKTEEESWSEIKALYR